MSWTWEQLSEVVRRLKMPAGEYTVDRVGYGLSRDRSSTADRVELLVTETGWRRLKERGWQERGGRTVLQHPKERGLRARVMLLDDVRHEIREVDGVPVVAVEPDPPAPERSGGQWSAAVLSVVLTAILAGVGYGFAVFYPDPDPDTVWQHLTFRTTEVRATVESSSEGSDCSGARVYDRSPRVDLTLSWTQDGTRHVADYTACNGSTESPQDIWVTADGDVASQHSPWLDHFWPLLLTLLVPFAVVVMPLFDRWRARRWRRSGT